LRRLPGGLAGLQHRIVMEGGDLPEGARSLDELERSGAAWLDRHPEAVDARIDSLGPGDLATLIHTSGTTGPPKGVMLVHDNWMFQAEALAADLATHLRPGDKQYLFLPLAHAFGKLCELIAVVAGVPTALEGDLDILSEGLQHTQPSLVAAVPRVFEKIHLRIEARAVAAGSGRHQLFTWAVGVGERAAQRRLAGQPLGRRLALELAAADRLVLRRLRSALGGRIRAFVSGGAPLSPELARFFYAAGMTILEGYGMTETSAGATANRLDDLAFGTVGRPLPGCEVRIGADGEILIRGRNVMRGYWGRPEATAAALEPDGWLHTGDLGHLDDAGRLHITGRIKDLIITAGGKNIAPQGLEHRLKAACPLLSEVVVVGDGRPCCVALAWIDEEAAAAWAGAHGLSARTHAELSTQPEVQALIQGYVERLNHRVAPHERLKRIHLVDHPITEVQALITPSLKVRRAAVVERYAVEIEALYTQR
ncbi:MAG TPA: long-chain fatty acid--CoA ligase, partial [Deltaproteobacteria bacterium]|nr:long-chain fatty acid--CoA ligase [Deltaproteobacteria bacterium]